MPRWVCEDPQSKTVTSEITTVGLDLAKTVFVASGASAIQVHGADGSGRAILRKKVRRDQVLAFFSQLPLCVVAIAACGGAHFWGREIGKMGQDVRLIPPTYAVERGEKAILDIYDDAMQDWSTHDDPETGSLLEKHYQDIDAAIAKLSAL